MTSFLCLVDFGIINDRLSKTKLIHNSDKIQKIQISQNGLIISL